MCREVQAGVPQDKETRGRGGRGRRDCHPSLSRLGMAVSCSNLEPTLNDRESNNGRSVATSPVLSCSVHSKPYHTHHRSPLPYLFPSSTSKHHQPHRLRGRLQCARHHLLLPLASVGVRVARIVSRRNFFFFSCRSSSFVLLARIAVCHFAFNCMLPSLPHYLRGTPYGTSAPYPILHSISSALFGFCLFHVGSLYRKV
ncbi:hypothetical protein F5884DRAFT_792050 [Xylogone sp. PMI_703]|nr:hypothetical protein F5884DRAFT_792050 [Xylogone sp. PMI_703]